MSEKLLIGVIGSGSWGTAIANAFCDSGHRVTIWGRDAQLIGGITERHENIRYLKGHTLHPALQGSTDLNNVLKTSELIVCSIPTQQIRSVFSPYVEHLKGKIVLNTAKGIEIGTNRRVSEIFEDLTPRTQYGILSGPSFADEVVRKLPAAVTMAFRDGSKAEELQKVLSNRYLRIYSSDDVVGVEIAGALKNVVAIASGIVVGLKLGYNAQSALINRGLAEIMRMGKKLGAKPLTFLGLAGMGDLILTCTGPLSRNRTLGVALGEGQTFEKAKTLLGGVAEGFFTARSAKDLADKLSIEMPITEQIYKMLYSGGTASQAVTELMTRDLKAEW